MKVKLNNVEGTVGIEGACDLFSTAMYNLGTNTHGIRMPVEINGKTIQIERDTGAGVSKISNETFDKHFKHVQLKPCTANCIHRRVIRLKCVVSFHLA